MSEYKFKSCRTREVLPSGVTHLNEITREEAILSLGSIKEKVFKKWLNYYASQLSKDITSEYRLKEFNEAVGAFKSDYLALKSKLIVKQPQTEQEGE